MNCENKSAISLPVYFKSVKKWKHVLRRQWALAEKVLSSLCAKLCPCLVASPGKLKGGVMVSNS